MDVSCFAIIILVIIINNGALAQINTIIPDKIEKYDEHQRYCFRFTWMGPTYDNTTRLNITCSDYLDTTRAVGVPCRQPLVVTHNSSLPDIDYMWTNHRDAVLCKQSKGHVCAKYSYSLGNEVQNITYMCTKVFATREGSVTSGCYKQIINGYEVELCVCESGTGPVKPCNSASFNLISTGQLGLIVLSSVIYRNYYLI